MKVLQINKFYHIKGGVDRYFIELSRLLIRKRDKVAIFSTIDNLNINSRWSEFFAEEINFKNKDIFKLFINFVNSIYSINAKRKIANLISHFNCDIAHVHNIYHYLSPSLIYELHSRNIPIIQTLDDYHLISPNYYMFHNDKICEVAKKANYYRAIFHKCVQDSLIYSLAEVIEKYTYLFLKWDKDFIDYFISPSKFMKNKLIEYGIPEKKIIHLPYFVDHKSYIPSYGEGSYILYFGRLSPEKGIKYLIKTMKYLPQIKLKIVGKGNSSHGKELKFQASKLHNVEFIPFQKGYKLKELIKNSRFTILPSVWYEVFGLSILESFASGKPVIASNIGGIPEVVRDGFNGYLFESGNSEDCAEKIDKLQNNPRLCKEFGRNAREYVERYFNPDKHYEKLMNIYKKAISIHQ